MRPLDHIRQLFGASMRETQMVQQGLHYRCCGCIRYNRGHAPWCKVLCDYQFIIITTFWCGEWSHEVPSNKLERAQTGVRLESGRACLFSKMWFWYFGRFYTVFHEWRYPGKCVAKRNACEFCEEPNENPNDQIEHDHDRNPGMFAWDFVGHRLEATHPWNCDVGCG